MMTTTMKMMTNRTETHATSDIMRTLKEEEPDGGDDDDDHDDDDDGNCR